MKFQDALEAATRDLKLPQSWAWKDLQYQCLKALFEGRNVAAVLPTGYGKSAIFQALPFLFKHRDDLEKPIVLVITPLNSIMMDQCTSLIKRGIPACYLNFKCTHATTTATNASTVDEEEDEYGSIESDVCLDDIKNGGYRIVYAHPETALCTSGRNLLRSIRNMVCAVAVDESHIVLEWLVYFKNFLPFQHQCVVPNCVELCLSKSFNIITC